MKEEQKRLSRVLVIGFGPIGKEVSKIAKDLGHIPFIIEQNIDTVSSMEEDAILFGDAAEPNILKDAHIEQASHLLITIPDTPQIVKIIHAARHANPAIVIIARTQFTVEEPLFEELDVKYICTEHEASKAFAALTREVLGSN